MNSIFDQAKYNPSLYAELVLILIALVGLCLIVWFLFNKLFLRITTTVVCSLAFIFYMLGFNSIFIVLVVFVLGLMIVACIQNPGIIHKQFANALVKKKEERKEESSSDDFLKKVETTVLNLSKSKTGALMVFERKQDLDQYIKNGTRLDTPFVPELVESIFYEGTRLHDGAMFIKGTTITAAAVFLPSTKKVLSGKYGARHRAAIGMSEVCDAIIVVVSEESGRISISYNGSIDYCAPDQFFTMFKLAMMSTSSSM